MNHNTFYGFTYPDISNRPYPIAAIIFEQRRTTYVQRRCQNKDAWVLDYSINWPGKFALQEMPWQERPQKVAHLYPPGKVYMEAISAGASKSSYILFKGDSGTLRKLVDNYAGFAQIVDTDSRIMNLIREGAQAAANGYQGYWRLSEVFSRIMDILEHVLPDGSEPWRYRLNEQPADNHSLAKQIKIYLEQNYQKHITLDSIATEFNCSKSTIVHKFKKENVESVMGMLMRIRVEQSIPLLLSGTPLKEIAAVVGLPNEYYYSRIFRKIIGMSPKDYRNRK